MASIALPSASRAPKTATTSLLILDMATEDFIGLWEVAWRASKEAKSSGHAIDDSELRSEVIRLVGAGHLELYRGVTFTGDETRVDSRSSVATITEPANWAPPEKAAEHYRITATTDGEAEYRRLYQASPG